VLGLGVAGTAVSRALARRGIGLLLADDRPTRAHRALADELGADLLTATELEQAVGSCALLVPAPGVPPRNPVVARALSSGVEVASEIELAYRWEADRPGGRRPMLAITGTDGKTTTTLMVAAIVAAAGRRCAAVGNTELPLVSAPDDAEVLVVECSSFRLTFTRDFRPDASAWLNLAPDHLDWHGDISVYRASKARMWAALRGGDVAVAPATDPSIVDLARSSAGRTVTFGGSDGDYRVRDGRLVGPSGGIVDVSAMSRSMPHDLSNALAACAVAIDSGLARAEHAAEALASFRHAAHRIEFVAESRGVRWYDDSKATSPHAASVALAAFPRIVLIAGGRNKDLDLSAMVHGSVVLVVAIGTSADEVATAFEGRCPVVRASSMDEAVELAGDLASPGDTVLLSPGCTSLDWYENYGERGDHFARLVRERTDRDSSS
jgi:UDP-N-acetylmuramoylalanine--D-glutamate ligase